MERILNRNQLSQWANKMRSDGKKIVSTNGCFDLLHVGHLHSLNAAKALGDVLIVGINSDNSVKKLKGENRPLNSEQDRAEILTNLRCVDAVTIFDEDTPVEFLKLVKPDIHTKGGDYQASSLAETPVVEAYGGRVQILKLTPNQSTTTIVERIQSV